MRFSTVDDHGISRPAAAGGQNRRQRRAGNRSWRRRKALTDRAALPSMFGAMDGEGWLDQERVRAGPHRLFSHWPIDATRPAPFTAQRTGFAVQLLREAFQATRTLRSMRRKGRGIGPDIAARGLGKVLIVAPDQAVIICRRYGAGSRTAKPTRCPRRRRGNGTRMKRWQPFAFEPSRASWLRSPWRAKRWMRPRSLSWRR
jgi:hypothetical protein